MLQIVVYLIGLFMVAIVHATPQEDWRTDKLCGERMPDFQTTSLKECHHASCTSLPDHTKLCVCEQELNNESATTVEQITANGQKTQLLKTGYFSFFYNDNAILLHRLNLTVTDSSKPSLLLGIMATEGNGIAIQRWQIWAITDNHVSKPIMVEDYGALSFATQAKHEKTCSLLVSQLLTGWEPKRGDGWYVAGHWYHLSDDGEFFASSRPTIYHRYLNSFAEKRGVALFDEKYGKQPFLWHKEPTTKALIGPDVFRYETIFQEVSR